ncbi:MAG: DNA-binding response regulator [Clostridia bacterium]|nr:DNA-binding response regulator [Clostridia bacterium]
MYRVAVLEGDGLEIKSVETGFNWAKYGMEVLDGFDDPKEMLSYLKTNDVDVIFTGIDMPNMTGFELIEEIKTKMGRDDILFVIVSGNDDYEYMRKAIRLGAVDYLKAPVKNEKTDEVLAGLASALKKLGKAPKRVEGRDFESLIGYINENYSKNLHLEDLSRKFYFNPNYLCMLFRRRLDTTFSEYIKSVRMNRAKELFESRNITVSEVSGLVGYRDYSYFHKTFSAYFGITPAQYKKSVAKKSEN